MAEEAPIKRPRGNPNFQKKKQENNTSKPMAEATEEKEPKEKEPEVKKTEPAASNGESTPPPAPDTLPADLFSDKMPGDEVLPLDGKVKEKAYAQLPGESSEGAPSSESAPSTDGVSPPPTPTPVEPPKTPEEIQSQAAQTADLMIRGYEKLHALGRWLGKVDQGDLTQQHSKGKINLEQVLPLGKKTITVQEFFTEYNNGIDENIVVSDEFKNNVRPPLIRICVKRGWLMSDEMYVGTLLAEDLSTKVSMLVGLKKSANLVLNAVQEMTKAQRNKGEIKTPPPVTEEHPTPGEETTDWHEPEVASNNP